MAYFGSGIILMLGSTQETVEEHNINLNANMNTSEQNTLQTRNPSTAAWPAGAPWAIVLSAFLLAGQAAQAAQTYNWVNDSGGEYGVAANWNPSTSVPGTTPSLNDVAQIGVASHLTPGTVLYDQSGYNYGFANSSLQIGQVANSTASITMSAGTLSVTNTGGIGFALGNANPSTGSFTNNGGTLFLARPSTAKPDYQNVASIPNAAKATGRFRTGAVLAGPDDNKRNETMYF